MILDYSVCCYRFTTTSNLYQCLRHLDEIFHCWIDSIRHHISPKCSYHCQVSGKIITFMNLLHVKVTLCAYFCNIGFTNPWRSDGFWPIEMVTLIDSTKIMGPLLKTTTNKVTKPKKGTWPLSWFALSSCSSLAKVSKSFLISMKHLVRIL